MSLERPIDSCSTTNDAESTSHIGYLLAQVLSPGDVVALSGELGSGKTCLVQGICRGLSVSDDVTSPTYTLVNEYRGRLPIYHFDLYRLEDETSVLDIGFEEYIDGPGVCLVEWADKFPDILPDTRIDVAIEMLEDPKRRIRIVESGR